MRALVETVVIGLGNPVLTDDGVGLRVVQHLARRLRGVPGIQVRELYSGGIRLMEAMAGFDQAVIVDAIVTEGGRPGTVYSPAVHDLFETRNTHSTHDGSLAVALEFGRLAGLRLPSKIRIWAIEARDVTSFSEQLTGDVERAVPVVINGVMRFLGMDSRASNGASI
jgi:hydrogenase maturation protease